MPAMNPVRMLDTKAPRTIEAIGPQNVYTEVKKAQDVAILRSAEIWQEVWQEYGENFGHHYLAVDAISTEDADIVFVTMGSISETYMNTGIQRSSSTPYGAWTTTTPIDTRGAAKQGGKKDMAKIAAAHNIDYVATACPGYQFDLMNKAKRAAMTPGSAYLHVLSHCPTGWKRDTRYAVQISKLAVDTRAFPLYEIINGQYVLGKHKKNAKPVEEYLKKQGRFKHLNSSQIQEIQDQIGINFRKLEQLAEMVQPNKEQLSA